VEALLGTVDDGGNAVEKLAYPGQVTRVRARFATPGQFVWHCHIVEDNEMMSPTGSGRDSPASPTEYRPAGPAEVRSTSSAA
jgi:hypothetical protein